VWDREPFSPALLGGAAGIGLFHLRVASPLVPSPLLPGPGSPALTLPSVSDETATRASVAGALAHFPRTERALAGAGIRIQVDAAADRVSTAAVRKHLSELVATLPASGRVRIGEALALETLAYEQACAHANRAEPLARSLTHPRAERLDHADARVRLATSTRLFHARHDWEPLLSGADAPRRAPGVYLVHDAPGGFVVRRLDDLGARLFSSLENATLVQELVERVATDIRTDVGDDEVRARLRNALRGACERGILEMVDPHDLKPSDITSPLCTRCGECCRVKIHIPGDAVYAEFIAAVLEAPLRASYPDLVIRHERTGGRDHVVLDLGYCHNLERGTDDGGHPTFRCGIYETRPEVCSDFNCVAWGRLQRMGSSGRTASDAALAQVAALKRVVEGEPGT
jgi:Fe-S-cluster containining protein